MRWVEALCIGFPQASVDAFRLSLGSRQGFFDGVKTCAETALRDGVERSP
jgi:hypothetical protein